MAYMRSNAIVRIVKILALVGVLAAMARGVGAATGFFASDHREAMLTTPVTSGSIEETDAGRETQPRTWRTRLLLGAVPRPFRSV